MYSTFMHFVCCIDLKLHNDFRASHFTLHLGVNYHVCECIITVVRCSLVFICIEIELFISGAFGNAIFILFVYLFIQSVELFH